jgi:signal transduction histidine kinase
MFAIPTYVFSEGRPDQFFNGALFAIAPELTSSNHLLLYQKSPLGWHVCGLGYSYYTFRDAFGTKYVFAGLMIEGARSPNRKLYSPATRFKKAAIEALASSIVKDRNQARESQDTAVLEKEAELGMLAHDLRALSTGILHAAEGARTALDGLHHSECRTRIENILATQTLLSIRIDSLDFAANPQLLTGASNISVFRKTDKVVRSLRARSNVKQIRIEMTGRSFGTVYGPNVFELVPYAILDNAIKYSPANQQIDVRFDESQHNLFVRFQSIGPRISPTEQTKIFEKGFRGSNATASGAPGTGIGLSMAHKLITEHFGGRLYVSQAIERFQISTIPYWDTEFVLELPRAS